MRARADAAAEEGDLVQRRVLTYLRHALLVHHRVLRERRRALRGNGTVSPDVLAPSIAVCAAVSDPLDPEFANA